MFITINMGDKMGVWLVYAVRWLYISAFKSLRIYVIYERMKNIIFQLLYDTRC